MHHPVSPYMTIDMLPLLVAALIVGLVTLVATQLIMAIIDHRYARRYHFTRSHYGLD